MRLTLNGNPKRQTGRTTRMLEEAIRVATVDHGYVFVFAATSTHAASLRKQCALLCGGRIAATKVYPEGGGEITFETPESALDWRSGTVMGAHPSCVVLVDHFAIEARFGWMLAMLHRFDL